MLSKEAVSLK